MTPHSDAQHELASAYLDNEVTPAERAQVESTPTLMALVESLKRLATLNRSVPTAGHQARESAIAAALAEFDARAGNSNVISLAGRRRWPTRVLSAAAAVVALGVVGSVVTSVISNRSDDKSETASVDTNTKVEAQSAEDAVVAAAPAEGGSQDSAEADAALAINDPQELLALAVPEFQSADSTPGSDGSTAETIAASEQLDSFNSAARACIAEGQAFLADIYYQGTLAIAVRDTVTGVTEAIDGNCTVLARVAP